MFRFKPEGISLNGMQRVYFTSHPEDHARHFERISGDILKVQRCAVFYNLDEGEYEDAETDLAQMNLFVIPVTTRLLTKPCRTVKFDIPFAMEHHIPILPLMMESGLDELYERFFGDLHYLDPNASDDTARSFEEKFKNYITSVLIGDELAEKIRSAFDAYIFLSYRKKDRRYANELMKLIHKNEFCRDIAIWYDEFLTPGEGFNEAIAAALEKSELFALVVTPNLVNEKNYVMSTEYPMARRKKKPVLAAEMQKANHLKLKLRFFGKKRTVNAFDEPGLSAALHDALGAIAKRENDNDPEHNFFIGLAYLGGMDVEIDHARAKTLIEGAAKAGLVEAVEKLVSMYENGEGVKRDYHAAIEWQKRLVEMLEKRAEEDGTEYDYTAYFASILLLANLLKNAGPPSEAEIEFLRLYELCRKKSSDFCGAFDLDTIVALVELGYIRQEYGNLTEAEKYFVLALKESKRLAAEGKASNAARNIPCLYNCLAEIKLMLGLISEAHRLYDKSYKIRKRVALETDTEEARRDLAVSTINIGKILEAQGDLKGAENRYNQAKELLECVWEETCNIDDAQRCAVVLGHIGDISLKMRDFNRAEHHYGAALDILERIVEESDTIDSRSDLSDLLNRFGESLMLRGDYYSAQRQFSRSYNIISKLHMVTNTINHAIGCVAVLANLGYANAALGNYSNAEALYNESLRLIEDVAIIPRETRIFNDVFCINYRLGLLFENCGDLFKAEKYFSQSIAIADSFYKAAPTLQATQSRLIGMIKLCDIRIARGNLPEAQRICMRALEIAESIVDVDSGFDAKCSLLLCLHRAGDIRTKCNDLPGAEKAFLRSLWLAKSLVTETDSPEAFENLAISYVKLAILHEPYDSDLLREAQNVCKLLVEKCPEVVQYRERLDSLEFLLNNL